MVYLSILQPEKALRLLTVSIRSWLVRARY